MLMLCISSSAQTNETKPEIKCPTIEVTGPAEIVEPGEPWTFTLSILGDYDPEKLEIIWEVDKGEIVSGQGTTVLKVTSPEPNTEQIANVTVKIGEGCEITGSESGLVATIPKPRLSDEFDSIPDEDMWARTDAFMTVLSNNPDATGYIIIYGPERQVKMREKRFRVYIRDRSFDTSRIIYVIGGKEDKIRTRIWIVPAGVDPSVID